MPSVSSFPLRLTFLFLVFCLIGVQSENHVGLSEEKAGGGGGGGGGDVCAGFSAPDSCPINCFRADPVCGADGVTYWCGCPDAACHGARVVKTGACDSGNAGNTYFPGQALLLIHIVWLILLGFSVVSGVF